MSEIEIDFIEQLTNNYYKDYESGYTRLGPHRADLRIAIDKVPAKDSLSRGEKKLLLAIIKLAQGLLLKQQGNKQVMLLIDDLSSELDKSKLEMLIELIKALDTQTFITNISENINEYFSTSKLFHVEQGSIHAEALLEL